ncbi:hypothetical protein [Pontibacter pudoricolor]|uniref:hypothetical protein n=1 Tax=Pontibacter pudoricolor TaxID=2694930 RepID=UPI0013913BFB|nr:hypothetical protein [Pontibacter pudoricolor]
MEATLDMWENVFTLISTLFSTTVGACLVWFFARKSEKDKIIHEDKKKLKKVLFYLLEIRVRLKASQHYDECIMLFMQWVREKVGIDINNIPPEAEEALTKPFEAMKDKIIEAKFDKESYKMISQQFDLVVHSLAEIDPLLAYRLSDKQKLKEYIEYMSSGAMFTGNLLFETDDDNNEVEQAIELFKPKYMKGATEEIESIIIDVTKLIDSKTMEMIQKKFASDDINIKRQELYQSFESLFEVVQS